MRIITTRRFLKKIIIFLLLIILFFFIKIYPTHALTTSWGEFPDAPSDAKNYFISYDANFKVFNIQYCKNDNEVIMLQTSVPIPNSANNGYVGQLGYCYNTQTNQRNGNTYRRNLGVESMSVASVLSSNFIDLSERSWNNEQSGSAGTRTFYYGYSATNRNRLLLKTDYPSVNGNYIYGYFANENIYNYKANGTTLTLNDVVLSTQEFPMDLDISYQLTKKNGYYELKLIAENYWGDTLREKQVLLIDESTGKETILPPNETGTTEETINVYFSKTYRYQIIDTQYNVLKEEIINVPNVEYDNFSVKINNIDTNNKNISYTYINNGNTTNYTCYHQIDGQNEIQDINCSDPNNNYTINLLENKNVNFLIYDNDNNLLFKDTQSFVLSVGQPFISFEENFEYNLLNIKILFNRYSTNYIAKYQIDNGQPITITPTQEQSYYNDIYSYIVYNLTENSIIRAFIYDNNNNLLASSVFNVNRAFIEQNNINNTDISNIFKNLSFNNISTELLQYITNFGNLIISTRLGTIIFTSFIISLLGLVIHLLRR